MYLKLKIKYRPVTLEAKCANYETIEDRRKLFAIQLATEIFDKRPVVYLDETTFDYHLRQARSWSKANSRIVFQYNNTRFKSVTIFGAIGDGLKQPHFMKARATNGDYFNQFLLQLENQIKPNLPVKPLLIIDGHRAHFTTENRYLIDKNFELFQTPSSSCQFNSIEWLWALFKSKFKKKISSLVGLIRNQEQLDEQVWNVVISVPNQTIQKFQTANREYILRYLNQSRM